MANVLPANAAQAFLEALATSQILNAEAVAKIRDQFATADDPKVVARDLIKEGKITKWQAGQLLHNFTALVVGNYKLLDQLGVGELGRVYLAEHVQMQRKVALKVLARKHTAQPQILRRILAEARRVAALEHPNVSHIQDVNQDGERYFIVLEYVEAQDLQRQVQTSGKLSAATAWNVIRQAAEGLAHAHSKGIMHGGLKPSNLLLDKQGAVKILDFGLGHLASGADSDSSDSVEQAAITGKMFRAPESGKGSVDRAADVYSLGATLFFLLTGKAPAEGPASPGQLATLASDTPKEMVQLCTKLMAAKPADRPADDQTLIAEIEAAKPGQAPTSPPKPSPKAAASPAAKTPAPTKAAALPTAKPMATAGAEEPAAKAAPPRAKKPLTAKALPSASDSQAAPVVAAETPATPMSETPAPAADDDNPFAGFAIKTKGKKSAASSGAMPAISAAAPAAKAPAAKAPPAKAAPPKESAKPAPADDASADSVEPAKGGKKAKGKAGAGGNLPLILAGGIGGGVLVLGAIIGLVMFLMSGGDKGKEVAKVDGEEQTATEQPTTPNAEANPGEANPPAEANPAVEANPVVPAEANPVTPPAEANPVPPVTPMTTPMPPAETPKPEVAPEAVKPDPPMVATVTPEVKPEPKPEVKPEPKPVPKPMPAGDPFVGFPRSVSLPKLPAGMSEPTPEMLAAVVLGPCKVPDENTVISAVMKGGATAYSKGKMTFTLESANGGTSLRDWEIKLAGGLVEKPVVVATLSAKNDQLLFQWTAEAAKQAAAPYLCNCMISMNAGAGKAEFGLREPISVDPIVIGIEKRTPMAKFNIDLPPEPKQLMVEIISVEGEIPKIKYDNKELVAEKDTTYFWVGNVETEMPFAIKVDTSVTNSGRTVQVATMPHFKIEPLTRPVIFGKKELGAFEGQIKGALQQGQMMIQAAGQTKDAKAKEKLNHDASLALEPAQKAQASFDQMLALAKGLDKGKIRFRIYASAEDGKVELVNSEGAGAGQQIDPAPPARAALNPVPGLNAPAGNVAGKAPAQPRGPRPQPNAAPARAPIGTVEITAEELGTEALTATAEVFTTKYGGKQFRISGTVDTLYPDRLYLETGATKNGDAIKIVLVFPKKGDTTGIAKGTKVVIDGEYDNYAMVGPSFKSCEVVSK